MNFESFRETQGISCLEMARVLGCNVLEVVHMETERCYAPSKQTLHRISNTFKLPWRMVNSLFGPDGTLEKQELEVCWERWFERRKAYAKD